MDADRFDTLARSLTAVGSRRRTLAALGLLGLADPDEAAAAKTGKCKPTCGECEKCKKGDCDKKDGKKVCKKGKCQAKANGTPCSAGTCQGRRCTSPPSTPVSVSTYQCPGPVETTQNATISPETERFAQTFTAAQSGSLQQIQFEIIKNVGSTGDYVVELLAASGDVPTNTVLATVTILNASVPDGTSTLTATFSSGPLLTVGTEYAAAVSRPSGSNLRVNMRTENDCTGRAFIQFTKGSGGFFQPGEFDFITAVIVLA